MVPNGTSFNKSVIEDRSNSIVSAQYNIDPLALPNQHFDEPPTSQGSKKSIIGTLLRSKNKFNHRAPSQIYTASTTTSTTPVAATGRNQRKYSAASAGSSSGVTVQNHQVPTKTPNIHNQNGSSNKTVIALYSYEGRDEGELSFEKNEKLIIVNDSEPDWWLAHKLNDPDRKGYIPMNFVVHDAIETEE